MHRVEENSLRMSDINNIVKCLEDGNLYQLDISDVENREKTNEVIVCPVCEHPVKIRNVPGKSLHYVHPNGKSHSNESFVHYFTKHFIANHISSIRSDIDICLEKTFPSGRRSDIGIVKSVNSYKVWNNIEIEYKRTNIYDFLQKMKCLHDDHVMTQWLLGYHKFFRRGKMISPDIVEYIQRFQNIVLTTRFLDDGTLMIGTVISKDSDKFAKEYTFGKEFSIKEVPLDECLYSPYIGIITPYMKQIYGWGKLFNINDAELIFEKDSSFKTFIDMFFPSFIYPHGMNYGIKELPVYWMYLIYSNFIFNNVGNSFTIDDILNFLTCNGIKNSKWTKSTLSLFLDHLENTILMCSSTVSPQSGESIYTITSDNPADFFLYSI